MRETSPNYSPTEKQTAATAYRAPKSRFVPIVIHGKLVFKFDATRGLIEWQDRGNKHIIDLADYAGEPVEEK